ncbi:MAG: hypothetical protein R3204_01150 [Oceanospirillum sp.]|nr:hypothetical protein [Oceanospirillum sp.]
MKTYQVEQFEIIARRAFNRVLLPNIGPDFDMATARVFIDQRGCLTIRDNHNELVFADISADSLQRILDAGGVHVMNPAIDVHPKLTRIPLGSVTH